MSPSFGWGANSSRIYSVPVLAWGANSAGSRIRLDGGREFVEIRYSGPLWLGREFLENYSGPPWLAGREFLENYSGPLWLGREFLENYSGPLWLGREFLENYSEILRLGAAIIPRELQSGYPKAIGGANSSRITVAGVQIPMPSSVEP